LATLSQAIISVISLFFGYADDGMDLVFGDSIKSCNEKLQAVAKLRVDWYRSIGLALNIAKTEIVGFNFTPDPILIDNITIKPKSELTFLGVKIQNNLKWTNHVNTLRGKILAAASRIRTDGRHLSIMDRRTLYGGWIQGLLHSNGLVYLPRLNQSEMTILQKACNAGVRAIVGLPRFGFADLTTIRQKLNIPTVAALNDRITSIAAWKKFANSDWNVMGPVTRSRVNKNFPAPDQKGHAGKISQAFLIKAWNKLPICIKNLRTIDAVKFQLKKLFK